MAQKSLHEKISEKVEVPMTIGMKKRLQQHCRHRKIPMAVFLRGVVEMSLHSTPDKDVKADKSAATAKQ